MKRSQLETELMNEKQEKELETLKAELEANMRELQEIQVYTYRENTHNHNHSVNDNDDFHLFLWYRMRKRCN